jgi:uncharacterized protein (DUF1015 family)
LADIRPFRGVHYNPAAGDLAGVVCPPYDIITLQTQLELYRRNEFNFVRIEFGRELSNDRDNDNRYTRAAATLERWLETGVLMIDEQPALYIDEHNFSYRGKARSRRSVTCLVRLEDWDKMVVRPHEGTLARPRSDRLNLMWALQADTSSIMALYEDKGRKIAGLLERKTRHSPTMSSVESDGESHRLWAVSDEFSISQIRQVLADQPLYIADGHHRYESALAYKRARRAGMVSAGEEPFDFVMMTLVDFTDPGLVILPAHRLVRGVAPSLLDNLPDALRACFSVERLPVEGDAHEVIERVLARTRGEVRLAMYGPGAALYALTLQDSSTVAGMMPYFHTPLYGKLDVSVVDHVIMGEMLGLTPEAAGTSLDYTNDAAEAVQQVNDREYQLAFIVSPVQPATIKAMADSGDRMPRKSTYFFPKIPAGLVFYRFA